MWRSNKPARACSAGFTLTEILVVVFIIAMIATTVVLAVGTTGRDRELEKESERMLALLHYVREQAELRTREFGLLCEEDGYRFVTFDPRRGEWRVVEEDEALRERELPGGLKLNLTVEARRIVLRRPPDSEDVTPQVMIFSNGDLTPFELMLERPDESRGITLASNEQGLIEAQPLEEQPR